MLFINILHFLLLCFSDILYKNLIYILHLSFSKIFNPIFLFSTKIIHLFHTKKNPFLEKKTYTLHFCEAIVLFWTPHINPSNRDKHCIELKTLGKYIDFLMYNFFSRNIALYQHPEVKKAFWDTLLILKVGRNSQF